MRYIFLALIPLIISGCVVRLPHAHYSHPAHYRYKDAPSHDHRYDRGGYGYYHREYRR